MGGNVCETELPLKTNAMKIIDFLGVSEGVILFQPFKHQNEYCVDIIDDSSSCMGRFKTAKSKEFNISACG